ncbi:MAG: replication protein RepA [Rhizomicrobium sp.]
MNQNDEFTRIGDILSKPFPAAKEIKPARKPKDITKAQIDLLNAIAAHQAQEYGTEDLAYMPSQLVQCTFPHDDPGTMPAWSRSTPWLTVTFQPGFRVNPKTRQPECIGYPYGTVPRLLMFYVMTEAERMKNRQELSDEQKRTIYLGSSLNKFMLNIGLNPDNGAGKRSDKRRLKNQVERFMRVRINFDQAHTSGDGYAFADTLISERGQFWWTAKHENQEGLFQSYIVLSESFYRQVMHTCVPLDMMALRALKNSSLHLDLYAWCLYRAYTLTRGRGGKPVTIDWQSFMMQLGSSYRHIRQFRNRVKKELAVVTPFLRHLKVEATQRGITVHPLRLAVIPDRSA